MVFTLKFHYIILILYGLRFQGYYINSFFIQMFIFFYRVWYILWIPMWAMLSSGGRFLDPCPMIGFINQWIRPFLVSTISPWHILLHLVCLMIFWILLPSLPAFLMCPRARWIGKCFVEYLCFVPLFACSLVSPRAWRAASINSVAILLRLNSYFFWICRC